MIGNVNQEDVYVEVAAWLRAVDKERTAAWTETDWRTAKHVVLVHGIAPMLGARPAANGDFPEAPEWFSTYLTDQHRLNTLRTSRLRAEAESVLAAAREAQIEIVPLKGAALFSCNTIDISQRPMSDLDFLVRPVDRLRFEDVLTALDYRLTGESPRHREFTCQRFNTEVLFRDGEHPDNPIKIEVHTWAGQTLLSSEQRDISPTLWEARTAPRALALHLAVHAGGNAAKRKLRQVQLRDIALLAPLLDAIDWAWLIAHAKGTATAQLTYSALRLAERHAAAVMPRLDALRAECGNDLLQILESAPLHAFTMLAPSADFAWEIQWFPPGAPRWRMRLRRALPLHRLALDSVRLRERYGLPLDAPPARAYAMHAVRALAWPAIILSRLLRGKT